MKIYQVMQRLVPACLILLMSCGSWAQPFKPVKPVVLSDYQVFPINGVNQIEPSGLTLKAGKLYAVGDKHRAIYRLDIKDDEAWLHKEMTLDSERDLGVSVLDLEGITTVNGDFVVVSEAHHRLILIQDGHLQWLPEHGNALYQSAFDDGLLQLHNAGMEGVAYLGDQQFLVAAERQPRGVITVRFDQPLKKIKSQKNQLMNNSRQYLHGRHPDLTGLFVYQDRIYGLQRNAYVVHELIKTRPGFYTEGQAWSYEHIVRDPKYAYSDMQFGHAEGLAVDSQHFYLVLDNNRTPNAKNPHDKRPLLIVAKRPVLHRGD